MEIVVDGRTLIEPVRRDAIPEGIDAAFACEVNEVGMMDAGSKR